jgi:ubiquinone/menaquinone biosynthesis C-methylase UbiE
VSFDRVADIYDATRGLPAEAVEQVANQIVVATMARHRPGTTFLEMGIGTGRIALPLIERGYSVTGVDISRKMMDHLQAKAPGRSNLTLVETDVTDLPFPDHSFDVVLAVHVLHLVPAWRKALDEAQRVARPGGFFVRGNDRPIPGDPAQTIRTQWRKFVQEAGAPQRPEYGTWEAVESDLTARGCRTAIFRTAQWEGQLRPIDLLEAQRSRTFSESWSLPEDILEAVHPRMLAWARERYGEIDRPLPSHWEFLLSVSRFPV